MAGHISVDDPLEDDASLINKNIYGFDHMVISNDNFLQPSSSKHASASSTSRLRNTLITAPPNVLAIRQNNPQDCSNLIAASVNRATVEISRTIIALNATFSQQLNQASISISNVQRSASIATSSAFFSLDLANRAVTTANLALTSAQVSASSAFSSFNSSVSAASSSFTLVNLALSSTISSVNSSASEVSSSLSLANLALSSSSSSEVLRLSSSLNDIQASLTSAQASASSALASVQSALAAVTADNGSGIRPTQTVVVSSPGQNLPLKMPQVGLSIGKIIGIVIGAVLGTILLGATLFFVIMKMKSRKERDSYLDEKDAGSPRNLPSRLSSAFRTGNGMTIKYNPPKSSGAPQPSRLVLRRPGQIRFEDSSPEIKNSMSTKIQVVPLDFGFSEQTTIPSVAFLNSPLMHGGLTQERRVLRSPLDQTPTERVLSIDVDLTRDVSRQPNVERVENDDTISNPFDDPAEEIVTRQSISKDNELDRRLTRKKSIRIVKPINPFQEVLVADKSLYQQALEPSEEQADGQIQVQIEDLASKRPLTQQPTSPIVPLPRIFPMFQEIERPRYSTVPYIERLIQRHAQENLDIGDKSLFWNDNRAPDPEVKKAMPPPITGDFSPLREPLPLFVTSAIRVSSPVKEFMSERKISPVRKATEGDGEGRITQPGRPSSPERDFSLSGECYSLDEDPDMSSDRVQSEIRPSLPGQDPFEDSQIIEIDLPSFDILPSPPIQHNDKAGMVSPRNSRVNSATPNLELALVSLKSPPLTPSHEEQRNRTLSPLRRNLFMDVITVEESVAQRDNSPASPEVDNDCRESSLGRQNSIAQRQLSVTGRNNQIRNITSLLASAASKPQEQPIEAIETDRKARGRSMVRTSDIIEDRMSAILRNKEKEAQAKEESMRERTTSPLRCNPVDPELLAVQREAHREKDLSPLRRDPSNGLTGKRWSMGLSPSKTLQPIPQPVSSEDLLPSQEGTISILPSQPLPSIIAIASTSAVNFRSSNALFSEALNKFQAMASENPVSSIAASTEVTQRAIAGIYIPGSLREQAVRNPSKNRETVNGRKSAVRSASRPSDTSGDARDRTLSPLRQNPM